jgi:UDP-N-acetylmuramoylalanine--D-glutamate ligase
MEFAGEFSGVDFYNDSKATNDHAAAVAVAAMCKPTLLLVGGVSKGGGYEHLVDALGSGVKQVLAFGEARFEFAEAFKDKIKLDLYETLAEAIEAACENAEPGEAVLLAPACSSFDEFTDYAQRGTFFKKKVLLLAGRRLGSGENDEIKS